MLRTVRWTCLLSKGKITFGDYFYSSSCEELLIQIFNILPLNTHTKTAHTIDENSSPNSSQLNNIPYQMFVTFQKFCKHIQSFVVIWMQNIA